MNMMTACCQRTKIRWGQVLRCQRYHTDKHKISCVHVRECIGYTELWPNAASCKFLSGTSSIYIWAAERLSRDSPTPICQSRVWQGTCRRSVDVTLQCTRPVESCQIGCHPVLGKQDEQDHESIQNIFHRHTGTGTRTFCSAVKAKSSL